MLICSANIQNIGTIFRHHWVGIQFPCICAWRYISRNLAPDNCRDGNTAVVLVISPLADNKSIESLPYQ